MKLVKKEFSDKYRKKWNIYMNDYVQLVDDDGNLINNNIYREGGMFSNSDFKKGEYFIMIKYNEEHYPDFITKEKKKKPYLEGRFCILNKNGVEKKVFNPFTYPYIEKNSVIYSIGGNYYNIETDEFYGNPATVINSENFIIIENRWNRIEDCELGVFKINKKDGTKELIDNIQ